MLRDHPIVETALDDPSPEVARVVAMQVHGSSALKKARLPAFGKVQVLGPTEKKRRGPSGWTDPLAFGCGGRIRTCDLQVMSLRKMTYNLLK